MCKPLVPGVNQYAMCLALMSASAASSAQPLVEGNTISWPDDGWYQVQNAASYDSLCEGGRECTVPDGSYIVINHSSGQRYADIAVPAEVSSDSVVVTGNTISWPDDGWYQVQDATTYESLCQGGRECEVGDGRYIVINLSTGVRHEDVVVPSLPAGGDGIVIDGNIISWPDDGWYQVQDATTYESLCQGGHDCEVPDGRYIVINHTTGDRFDDVLVESGSVIEPPVDARISAANALPLFQEIVALINENEVRSFLAASAGDVSTSNESSLSFPMPQPSDDYASITSPSDGEATDYVMAVPGVGQAARLFDYACFAGGGLSWYIGSNSYHDMVFDNCVVDDNTYNGTASRRMNTLRGEYPYTYYTGFARTDSDGQSAELSGQGVLEYFSSFSSLRPLDYQSSWSELHFSVTAGETQKLQISDYGVARSFTKVFDDAEGPYCRESDVDGFPPTILEYTARDQILGQFEVSADWSDGQVLSVDLELSAQDSVLSTCDDSDNDFSGHDPYVLGAWTGQIQVDAADGSSMTVRSVSDSETGVSAFVIDLDNGEQLGPVDWSDGYVIEARPWEVD